MLKKIVLFAFAAIFFAWTLPAADPNEEENAVADAANQFSIGNIDAAREALTRITEANPNSDAGFYYLGLCDERKYDFTAAETHLRRASELDPENIWYSNSLADLYLTTGRQMKAAPIYKHLIEVKPGTFANPYTLTLVGKSMASEGSDSLAMDYYSKALAYSPDYAPAILGQSDIYFSKGNTPAYFSSIGKIIGNPGIAASAKTAYIRELLQRSSGSFFRLWKPQITDMVDKCIELHPDHMEGRALRMNLYAIERDTLGMINECEKIIAHAEKDTASLLSALNTMGDLYHSLGNSRKSYSYYEKGLAVDPEYVPILNNYAYFLSLEHKQLRKALKMSLKTIEKEPDNAVYLDTCGWILHLMGRDREAQPHFKRAMIYGGKSSPEVLLHYSAVLLSLGDKNLSDYYANLAEQKK